MSTIDPYFYVGPTTATVKDACIRCDATGTALDGASAIVTSDGNWGFKCRDTAENLAHDVVAAACRKVKEVKP